MDETEYMTSQTGWAKVDYDKTRWIPVPPVMPDGYDTDHWAQEFAMIWWDMSGRKPRVTDVATLAARLAWIGENTYGNIPCHQAFIHLPDPRLVPLPVYLAVLAAHGERTARLRSLTVADIAGIKPSIVDDFPTDRLGDGLRVLRYFADQDSPPRQQAIDVQLSYAWRSEEFETDLRLFTASPDLGRLQRAIPDIDELARHITAVPVP
jgi:hypothetical protein